MDKQDNLALAQQAVDKGYVKSVAEYLNAEAAGRAQAGTTPIAANVIGTQLRETPPVPPRPTPGNNSLSAPPPTYPTPEPAPTPQPSVREQITSKLLGTLSGGDQTTREQVKMEVGFNEKQKRAQSLQNDILRLQEIRSKQIEELEKNPEGVAGAGVLSAQINKKLDENSKELAKLNLEYRLANEDFIGAQQAVNDRLQDIKDQRNYELNVATTLYNFLQNDLTESEKLQMQNNIQFSQLEYKAKLDKEAALYEYQLETGDFSGSFPGEGQVATSTGNYDVSTYATDPLYAQKIQNLYNQNAYITSPELADEMIKAKYPKSKITGKEIFEVAKANNIDPVFFMTQIELESRFGTEGAATKNTNFGGVKYVGQKNATRGTLSPDGDGSYYANFNTVKDALDVQAKEIAKRKVGPTIPKNSTVPVPEIQAALDTGMSVSEAVDDVVLYYQDQLGINVDAKMRADWIKQASKLQPNRKINPTTVSTALNIPSGQTLTAPTRTISEGSGPGLLDPVTRLTESISRFLFN